MQISEWFNIVAWGNLAEICNQYLHKGQQVYIEGRLQTRNWEDKEGKRHTSVEVVANEMLMLGDRREASSSSQESEENEDQSEPMVDEDEFPF